MAHVSRSPQCHEAARFTQAEGWLEGFQGQMQTAYIPKKDMRRPSVEASASQNKIQMERV